MIRRAVVLSVATSLWVHGVASSATVQFVDQAAEAGFTLKHVSGAKMEYIGETKPGGAAFLDYDNDGDADIYITNGSSVYGFPAGEHPYNRLYRNDGAVFKDVTIQAGVGDTSWSFGCTAADYDNDGFQDIYVTNNARNTLYRNRGDGTFADVTEASGSGDEGYSTGSAFGDYDRDGDLDLFIGHYIRLWREHRSTIPCVWKLMPIMCGPRGMLPDTDVFYRNNGDGTFTDVTEEVGLVGDPLYALGAVFADFNEDGWPDIFVANDCRRNLLYINQQDGRFEDRALMVGVGYNDDGISQACMGVAVGDYDNDGHFDIFVTNWEDEYNTLYRNEGDGFFMDVTTVSGDIAWGAAHEVSWGNLLFDYDNDGDQDMFVANGHTYPQADAPHTNASYRQLNSLFENQGNGMFADVSKKAGPGLAIEEVSRGAITADYDGDGDLDIFVMNLNSTPNLLRNDGGNQNNYIFIKTVGTRSNRDGVGTRVEVTAEGRRQAAEVRSGSSFVSHSDMRVHFGLGQAERIKSIVLRWPSGEVQRLEDVAENQVLTVVEPESP